MVLFSFNVGNEQVELSVRSMVHLNDDRWHRVEVEKNIKEAGLQLDGQYREVRSTSLQGHTKVEFYSDLYVGKIFIITPYVYPLHSPQMLSYIVGIRIGMQHSKFTIVQI